MSRKIKRIIVIFIILFIISIIGFIIINNLRKSYDVEEVIEEKYLLLLTDNGVGVKDVNENVIIEPQYYDVHIPNPSKSIFVCCYDYNEETDKYRTKVINEYETELFTKYNKIEAISLVGIDTNMPYEKSVLKYEEDGKYGLIDLKGNLVVKAKYDSIEGLSNKEGELLVYNDGKCGVINTKGAELISPKYDYITGDEYYTEEQKYALSGYILGVTTTNGYRYGYMTYKGKKILDEEYNEIQRLGGISLENTDKDLFLVAQKNGQYGLIKNKKTIIDFRYQTIGYSGVENLLIVTRSAKTGVYDTTGEKILAVKYDEVEIHDTYIQTKLNGEIAYYNLKGNRVDKSTIEELKEKK